MRREARVRVIVRGWTSIGILVCPVGAAFTIAALVLVAAVDIMRPLTATSFGRTIGDEGER